MSDGHIQTDVTEAYAPHDPEYLRDGVEMIDEYLTRAEKRMNNHSFNAGFTKIGDSPSSTNEESNDD